MPKFERWENFPEAVRRHLIERMRDRAIGIADLNRLRLWVETRPEVPLGDWYKDFGSFKICGRAALAKTFLLRGQVAKGGSLPLKPEWQRSLPGKTNAAPFSGFGVNFRTFRLAGSRVRPYFERRSVKRTSWLSLRYDRIRQSVTIPATLAAVVPRVAKERHVTMSRALVDLAERGVRAEAKAKQQLKAAYRNFVEEAEPSRNNEAGRDPIRAIFGKDSLAAYLGK